MKVILLTIVLALAMGCVNPAPEPFLARQLDVKIDPKDAATFLLNPSPLGKGDYPQGMIVTIDILPQQGWQVDEWVGPVFNIDGTTAQIQMDSSQAVAVRLKLTTPPTATPTPVPAPTYTPQPTPTARVIFVSPTPTRRPPPTPSASSYYNKCKDYSADGKYQLAVNEFNKAIRLVPSYISAYNNRGYAYGNLGQWQRAIEELDKAIHLYPNYAKAYNNRGYAYRKVGNYAKSDADKARACSLDRQHCD